MNALLNSSWAPLNTSWAATYNATVAASPAVAAAALENIASVNVEALKKGWKYTATMHDGTTSVIRACSTRLYHAAHLHADMVCTGKQGLGAVVSFGMKPCPYVKALRSYTIQPIA